MKSTSIKGNSKMIEIKLLTNISNYIPLSFGKLNVNWENYEQTTINYLYHNHSWLTGEKYYNIVCI